jgi:hypothetical protein
MLAVGGFIPVVGPALQAVGAGFVTVGAIARHVGNKMEKQVTEKLEEVLDASREQVLPLEDIDVEAARREMGRALALQAQEEGDAEDIEKARASVNQAFNKIKFEGQG